MQPVAARLGGGIQRRLGLVLVILAVAVGGYLAFPRVPHRPALALVALDASGRFQQSARIPREWADTEFTGVYGATARVPLILALVNTGSRPATPSTLELSVPARFRLFRARGRELPHRQSPTSPLVRYVMRTTFGTIEPGRLPVVPPGLDTLWLEPIVPALYCAAGADSVPDFVPATPPDPRLLASIEMFYSFGGRDLPGRQAGLLKVRIDSSLVRTPEIPTPPTFPTEIANAGQPLPQMGTLVYAGTTTTRCGAPEDPLTVTSQVWRTGTGGRFLVLLVDGKPRKYLFDLDGNGIVELEMWDPDGDGRFEARRQARFPLPAFLLPRTPPPAATRAGPPADSAALAPLPGAAPPAVPPGSAQAPPAARTPGVKLLGKPVDSVRAGQARPPRDTVPQ